MYFLSIYITLYQAFLDSNIFKLNLTEKAIY